MSDLAGRTLGPYRLLGQIGLGGMALVFKAYHPAMDRYVAIKVLPQHLAHDPAFRVRFDQEARTIARLEHRYILPVHDVGEEDDIFFLVMRYIDGGTLTDLIDSGELPLSDIVRVTAQVGEALDFAHRQGVIHRDIKPANVLISRDGNALLNDFGIAKIIEGAFHITGDGALIGTPAYMAPEQVLNMPVDGRADIYALGVILYEMLAGRRPFVAETPLALALMHVYNPLLPPSQINPSIPEPLERIVRRALAKNVSDRFQTAGEMCQALNAVQEQLSRRGAPVTVRFSNTTHLLPLASPQTIPSARPSSTVVLERRQLHQAHGALAVGRYVDTLPSEEYTADEQNFLIARASALGQVARAQGAPVSAKDATAAAPTPSTPVGSVRLRSADDRTPYLGLNTFQEHDAALFFGREALVASLVSRLRSERFLAVLGSSGSGKSSVVLAGLLPALKNGALVGSEHWRYLTLKPGARPLDGLAVALTMLQGNTAASPARSLDSSLEMRQLLLENDQALLVAADRLGLSAMKTGLVLVIDQFEELWTQLPADAAARKVLFSRQQQPFIRLLLAAAAAAESPFTIILTMRADFLHRVVEHRDLAAWFSTHTTLVSPMQASELHHVIERPAQLAGGTFEPGLVDELLEHVEGQPGALPLLEYTLLELWRARRSDGTMNWSAFRALGGVEGALAARADRILSVYYTQEQRAELRQILTRLVQPGEGAADTRRRALLEDLVPAGTTLASVQTLLKPLADERLLTTGRDIVTGAETLEISHEALIRAWPTLTNWINETREDLRLQIQLEEAAKEWRANGEHSGFLWSNLRLERVQEWIDRARPLLNQRDQAFIEMSREHERARLETEETARREHERLLGERAAEQRNAARLRVFLTVAGILLLLALFLGGFALFSRQAALRAEADARSAALVSDQARAASLALTRAGEGLIQIDRQPERAMLLTLSSIPSDTAALPPMVSRALYRAFDDGVIRRVLAEPGGVVTAVAWGPGQRVLTANTSGTAHIWDTTSATMVLTITGHVGAISAVAWSSGGDYVVTGGNDRTARIWSASTGRAVRQLTGHTEAVRAVAFSSDDRMILSGSADKTARIWDAATGRTIHVLSGHTGAIRAVAWSPDMRYVLTGGEDGTARIWDAATGAEIRQLRGQTGQLLALSWSADGRYILTGGFDRTARIWDAATGTLVRTLTGHTNWIYAATFSPDGRYALTSSADQTARVWDVESGAQRRVLRGHTSWVYSAAFSRDGRYALTGGADGSTRIWEMTQDRAARTSAEHASWIFSTAWSPDGKWLVAGDDEGRPRLWDAEAGVAGRVLSEISYRVTASAWSADSQLLLLGDAAGVTHMLDARSGAELRALHAPSSASIYGVAWSPDRHKVITGAADGAVRIWDAAQGTEIHMIDTGSLAIFAVGWSPDGRQFIGASEDGTAHIWDATGNAELRTLKGHTSFVYTAAWSSDGRHILTSSADGTARIWDAATGAELRALTGHEDIVYLAAWRPDDRQILTASADGTARIWDAATGAELRALTGHTGEVQAAAWSPNGHLAFTADAEGTLRFWLLDTATIVSELTRRVCDLFTDNQVGAEIPGWGGCAVQLAGLSSALSNYHAYAAQIAAVPSRTPLPTDTATPFSTATPVQAATNTAQPASLPRTAALNLTASVNVAELRLRAGPGVAYASLATYAQNTLLDVIGRTPSGAWLQVQTPDARIGWMLTANLRFDGALSEVPVVEAPPLPTRPPTPRSAPTPQTSATAGPAPPTLAEPAPEPPTQAVPSPEPPTATAVEPTSTPEKDKDRPRPQPRKPTLPPKP